MRLILLPLILLPLIEIWLMVEAADAVGTLALLAWLAVAAALGVWILRRLGPGVLRSLRNEFQDGRPATRTLKDGALTAVAALLLILPGILSDVAALPLLAGPGRRLLLGRHRPGRPADDGSTVRRPPPRTIDLTARELPPDDPRDG